MYDNVIDKIDTFVEGEYGDDWSEFVDDLGRTREIVKNPDVVPDDHIVDEDGWLRGPEEESKRWNGSTYKYRPIVYREVDEPGVYIPGVGRAVSVEEHGGEGQGDEYWAVFKVTSDSGDEQLYKRHGYWVSHDGGTYDGPTEAVKPVEKTITVYEPI